MSPETTAPTCLGGRYQLGELISSRIKDAVAPVVKGVCQGCHMALPPQLANVLARMESIQTCPRCRRVRPSSFHR